MHHRNIKRSRFYLQLNFYTLGQNIKRIVPFSPILPTITDPVHYPVGDLVVVSADEGTRQGLHLWEGKRWVYILSQVEVSEVIQKDLVLNVYYNYQQEVTFEEETPVFRNGVPVTLTKIEANDKSAYCYLTEGGEEDTSVKSVNHVFPDETGNVTLTQYLEYAISVPYEPLPDAHVYYQEITEELEFESATASIRTPPSAEVIFTIFRNEISEGSVTFSPSGNEGIVYFPSNLSSGDVVEIVAPEELNDASTFSITFTYRRA